MKHLSQTVKIGLALLVALFSNGLLPAAAAYATTEKPVQILKAKKQVFCNDQGESGTWKAQIGGENSEHELPLIVNGEPVYVHDQDDVTPAMDQQCQTQYATQRVTAVDGTFFDDCGTEFNLAFTAATTPGITYNQIQIDDTVIVTATALPGYTLTNPEWEQEATDTLIACPVILTPVTADKPTVGDDLCETAEDTYIIPSVTGVIYKVDGEVVAAGEHTTGGATRVEVTAEAATGYVLEGKAKWTLRFTDKKCQVKVTICHATSAVKNPYNKITVNESAVDGIGGKGDHYLNHTGPIYNPATMDKGDDWGDIIPPVGGHAGLNWTTLGQFILNNDCQVPAETEVSYEALPCVANNTTPSVIRVEVFNTADKTKAVVTYQVTVDGVTKTIDIADGESGVVAFDNIASGSYALTVTGTDGTDYTMDGDIEVPACAAPVFSPVNCESVMGSVIVNFDDEIYHYTLSGTGIVGEVALEDGEARHISKIGTYTVRAYAIGYNHDESYRTAELKYTLLASWTHTYGPLDCDGGQGSTGGETPKPAPVAPLLPAELPYTGPAEAGSAKGLLFALVAAAATYGAVYFAQPKRRYE